MDTRDEIQDLYQEWQRLAQAEGAAIRAGEWPLVNACQQALLQLQPRIRRATDAAKRLAPELPGPPSQKQQLLNTLRGLIDLAQRNAASLALRRQDALARMTGFRLADRNLRRIQQSYTVPAPASWTSAS